MLIYGVVTSQWTQDSDMTRPKLFDLFGADAIIEDVTGESVQTVLNDPNFVNNGVWATQEVWDEIDNHPDTLVLYYG